MNVLWQRRRKQTARCWIEGGIHGVTQYQPTVKAYCEVNTWFGGHPDARRSGNEFANMLRDIQVADQSLQSPSDNEERARFRILMHHAGLWLPTLGHGAEGQIATAPSSDDDESGSQEKTLHLPAGALAAQVWCSISSHFPILCTFVTSVIASFEGNHLYCCMRLD